MIYECIESFAVNKHDDDGSLIDGTIDIEKGSLWELNGNGNIIGVDHHLDSCDGKLWIEIWDEDLRAFFKEAEKK